MAHLITIEIEAPPDTVNVFVDFYDTAEKTAFRKSSMAGYLKNLPVTLKVPTPDLCAYFLYYKKRPGVANHSTHEQVAKQWQKALVEFDGQMEFANSSIRLIQRQDSNRGTTERLGEAFGLGVSSQIHSLHQADWTRIPESNQRKTLDFWYPWVASDGKRFVQLETKGAAAKDNRLKSSSVSQHKDSIKKKKAAATDEERKSSVLYGSISVLDDRPDSVVRCWLVDPPVNVPDNPERFKIVTRLSYIANLISLLAPSSSFAAAAQNRIAALNVLTDIAPLRGRRLLKGNRQEFSGETFATAGKHNPLFTRKSVVIDGPVGGYVSVVNKTCLLFVGMREELVTYALNQDFDEIHKYRFDSATLEKNVSCVIPKGRFTRRFSPFMDVPMDVRQDSRTYVHFVLKGQLHYTQSGLVFGALPVPADWQRK